MRAHDIDSRLPLGDTVAYLQRRGVTHVALHCALWYEEPCGWTRDRLAEDPRFRLVITARWQHQPSLLYELQR